jgi:glycosyltransferase involved in cell wall biosynthesis
MVPVLIVPTFNRYDLLDRLLDSIDHPVETVIVVDNGGRCPQLRIPGTVHQTIVWRIPDNLGVSTSWNFGIVATQSAPWWLIAGDDCQFEPGMLAVIASEARRDAVVLADVQPRWSVFTIGDQVVARVGLFDDNLHPAYFEDNDYAMRCSHKQTPLVSGTGKVRHDNSSTIGADRRIKEHNDTVSFPANKAYFDEKIREANYEAGRFNLYRRRRLAFPK